MAFHEKGPSQKLALILSILLVASLALSIYTDIVGVYNDRIETETSIAACEADSDPGAFCFRFFGLKNETDDLFRLLMLVCSVPLLLLVRTRRNEKVQFLLLSVVFFTFGLWAMQIAILASAARGESADLFWTAFDTNVFDISSLVFAISLLIVKMGHRKLVS